MMEIFRKAPRSRGGRAVLTLAAAQRIGRGVTFRPEEALRRSFGAPTVAASARAGL